MMKMLKISAAFSLMVLSALRPCALAAGDPNTDTGVGSAASRGPYGFNNNNDVIYDTPPNDYGVWRDAYGGLRDRGMVPDNLTTSVPEPTWEETHRPKIPQPQGAPGGLGIAGGVAAFGGGLGIGGVSGINGIGRLTGLGTTGGLNTVPFAGAFSGINTTASGNAFGFRSGLSTRPPVGVPSAAANPSWAPQQLGLFFPSNLSPQFAGTAGGLFSGPQTGLPSVYGGLGGFFPSAVSETSKIVRNGVTTTSTITQTDAGPMITTVRNFPGPNGQQIQTTTTNFNGNTFTVEDITETTRPGQVPGVIVGGNNTSLGTIGGIGGIGGRPIAGTIGIGNPVSPLVDTNGPNVAGTGNLAGSGGGTGTNTNTPLNSPSTVTFMPDGTAVVTPVPVQADNTTRRTTVNQTISNPNAPFTPDYSSLYRVDPPPAFGFTNPQGSGPVFGFANPYSTEQAIGFTNSQGPIQNLTGGGIANLGIYGGVGAGLAGGGYGGGGVGGGAIVAEAGPYTTGGGSTPGEIKSTGSIARTGGAGPNRIVATPGYGANAPTIATVPSLASTPTLAAAPATFGPPTQAPAATIVPTLGAAFAGQTVGPMPVPPAVARAVPAASPTVAATTSATLPTPPPLPQPRLPNPPVFTSKDPLTIFGGPKMTDIAVRAGLSSNSIFLGGHPQPPLGLYNAAKAVRVRIMGQTAAVGGLGPRGNVVTDLESKLAAMQLTPFEAIGCVIGCMRYENGDILTYGTRGTLHLASDNSGDITLNSGEIITFRCAPPELRSIALRSTLLF